MKAYTHIVAPEQSNVAKTSNGDTWDAWHLKLEHLGKAGLERLKREGLVEGLTISDNSPPLSQCEACIQAKMTLRPFPQEAKNQCKQPGELTHDNIWGPARVESLQKSKYSITFTNDATRRCRPKFSKQKSESFRKMKEYITFIKQQNGVKPKVIWVDNAKELTGGEVKEWLKKEGIHLQTPAPYAHSSNRVAERFNHTLVELTRTMLIAQGLP